VRLNFFVLGIVFIFIGLLLIEVSQAPVTTKKENTERVAVGEANSAEINATLNAGDEFTVSYSGGSQYVSPEDIDVVIYSPHNKSATVSYMKARNGIVANYTGLYKMQLLGLFIDPSSPFILTVMRINRETVTTYPNSNLLPVGTSTIVAGTGVSVWGAMTSKKRRVRSKSRKR